MASPTVTIVSTRMAYSQRGLSTLTNIPKAALGQTNACTGRSMPIFSKAIPATCAVVVWVAAAGLTATWYLLTKVLDHEPPPFHPTVVELDDDFLAGIPQTLDWSAREPFPEVAPAFYQWYCGSCWALATVKSIEAAYSIRTGKVLKLSVQQLVDCGEEFKIPSVKNGILYKMYQGCLGGVLHLSFPYVALAGLTTEARYPCSLWQGRCRLGGKPIAVEMEAYYPVAPHELAYLAALQAGPIAVIIYANECFSCFRGGRVLEIEDCPSSRCDKKTDKHAVVVVGYGVDEAGPYWKIMNVHGVKWGEKGYARLRRGGIDPRGVAGITRFGGYIPLGVKDVGTKL